MTVAGRALESSKASTRPSVVPTSVQLPPVAPLDPHVLHDTTPVLPGETHPGGGQRLRRQGGGGPGGEVVGPGGGLRREEGEPPSPHACTWYRYTVPASSPSSSHDVAPGLELRPRAHHLGGPADPETGSRRPLVPSTPAGSGGLPRGGWPVRGAGSGGGVRGFGDPDLGGSWVASVRIAGPEGDSHRIPPWATNGSSISSTSPGKGGQLSPGSRSRIRPLHDVLVPASGTGPPCHPHQDSEPPLRPGGEGGWRGASGSVPPESPQRAPGPWQGLRV